MKWKSIMAAPRDEYKEKEESETFCRRLCILFLCSYDEVPRVFRSSILLLVSTLKTFCSVKSTIIEKPIIEWHRTGKTDATIQSFEISAFAARKAKLHGFVFCYLFGNRTYEFVGEVLLRKCSLFMKNGTYFHVNRKYQTISSEWNMLMRAHLIR